MGEPRLTSYERLDGREVHAVLSYLGERIDQFLPRHPGLRTVTTELDKVVLELLERGQRAPRQRAALEWVSRILIGLVLAVAVIATGTAVRDAVSQAGALRAFEW